MPGIESVLETSFNNEYYDSASSFCDRMLLKNGDAPGLAIIAISIIRIHCYRDPSRRPWYTPQSRICIREYPE